MRLLSTADAAYVMGVTPATVRAWKARGLLRRHGTGFGPSWDLEELVLARDAPKPRRDTPTKKDLR